MSRVLEGVMHFDLNDVVLATWNAKPTLLMFVMMHRPLWPHI